MIDLEQWFKNKRITEIECLVPDMTGNARGKFIPAGKFLKLESRLPESILAQTVTGSYTDIHYEILDPKDTDMLLEPDPETVRLVPWANEPTAQVIHDCFLRDGDPHPLSTRNVLKRVLKLYEDEGWKAVIAPEMEFYLVEKNDDPDNVLRPPVGRSGRRETARQSYSIDAANEFEEVVELMYTYCEAQQLDVDTLIHESGAAQMEVNFVHGDPLNLADQVFTFKRTLREAAMRKNMFATFMAKPMSGEPGSAMHIHQSVIDINSGRNIFIDDQDEESELLSYYIGGMQKYIPSVISLFAPNVNSYRRFTPDDAAPINLSWGYDNRTAGLRVPYSLPSNKRIENRFPGADANPYLAIAASLVCGYLGVKNKVKPSAPHEGTANEKVITVARNLEEGLRMLDEHEEVVEIFGEQFIRAYKAVKIEEYEAFNRVISSWEREHLLLNV